MKNVVKKVSCINESLSPYNFYMLSRLEKFLLKLLRYVVVIEKMDRYKTCHGMLTMNLLSPLRRDDAL